MSYLNFESGTHSSSYKRPIVLSIAGFDPCGGAGITADTKVFEQLHTIGMTVITAITYQHESNCMGIQWLSWVNILQQCMALMNKYTFSFVKIGMIKNDSMLIKILLLLKEHNPSIFIIWDPILYASAGNRFFTLKNKKHLTPILQHISLITPNFLELKKLTTKEYPHSAKEISIHTSLLIKGGHRRDKPFIDELWYNRIIQKTYRPNKTKCHAKHGTGCVLSAAILAYYAHECNIERSIKKAKKYIEAYLCSSYQLIGHHAK